MKRYVMYEYREGKTFSHNVWANGISEAIIIAKKLEYELKGELI